MAAGRIAVLRVIELAPRMCVAGYFDNGAARGQVNAVITAKRVCLQIALEAGRKALRAIAGSRRRVVKPAWEDVVSRTVTNSWVWHGLIWEN